MVGWARMTLHAMPGQRITFRYGEMLNPDGTLYTANLRGATATDFYISKTSGRETFEPSFTFHGFRYVEVRGLSYKPEVGSLVGVLIHSAMERTGNFQCSNPLVNQLYHNIIWSNQDNYVDVPTDCPQRDERAGWTGDAQFFIPTAAYNFNVDPFIARWLTTLCEDAQNPDGSLADVAPDLGIGSGSTAWGDASIICAYNLYRTYGDTRVIESHFPSMQRLVDWYGSKSTNGIANIGGFGDWLNLGGGASNQVIDTAYYAYLTGIMSEMAGAIGNQEAASRYSAMHKQIKQAFAGFFQPDGSLKDCSQTGYALAFSMDLVPDALRAKAAAKFAESIHQFKNHLATGFIGTPRLLPALHLAGRDDLAYGLLLQDTFPSWLYQVKLGATTMWERWDGWTPDKGFQTIGMNSFNHYAFGSVGQYLYGELAGIQADSPAYKIIRVEPEIRNGLEWASGTFDSMQGRIASSWKLKAGQLDLDVTIPVNTTATICVPGINVKSDGVKPGPAQNGVSTFLVGSGTYHFRSTVPHGS
jgi:alpha-L-rhamnosidase